MSGPRVGPSATTALVGPRCGFEPPSVPSEPLADDSTLPMSQTDQLVSKAIELQRNTLENGQRAMEQAVELPLQQSVALQRDRKSVV